MVWSILAEQAAHAAHCTSRGCVEGCGWAALDAWLDQPTSWGFDQAIDARFRQRSAALLRGEIPA